MYDEYVNIPALALMALGVPFYLLGEHWAYGRPAFMGAQSVGNVSTSAHPPQAAALLPGGTGYCHGVGNIPVEASGSTRVGTFFFFYIRPCLSFSPSPFGISLPQAWLCIISYVFYHHLDKIEGLEKRSERQRIKHLPKPKLPCPARCAACTESRPPKGQLKCFIRPARA
jgi:hypothetical protein